MTSPSNATRQCRYCGAVHPMIAYRKNGDTRGWKCRDCRNAAERERYIEQQRRKEDPTPDYSDVPVDERRQKMDALFYLEEYDKLRDVWIIGERVDDCNEYWWIQFYNTPKQAVHMVRKSQVRLRRTVHGQVRIVKSDLLLLAPMAA